MKFFTPQHPSVTAAPRSETIDWYLDRGWVAQVKWNGRRIVWLYETKTVQLYNRHGSPHTKSLNIDASKVLKDMSISAIFDGEWMYPTNQFFFFDIMHYSGKDLKTTPFLERHKLLLDLVNEEYVVPVITEKEAAAKHLFGENDKEEGLVFRHPTAPSMNDVYLVRCRKDRLS